MGKTLLPTGRDNNRPEKKLTKRAYKSPKLYSYGTLQDITLTVGRHGHPDGKHKHGTRK